MNGDTPGASSADDFDFLGPAISPRQAETSDLPSGSDEELAGPFIAARPASGEVPAAGGESGGGEPAGGADWRDDDLPWLIPVDAGQEDPTVEEEAGAEPWRATGEVEDPRSSVEWGGEPVSLEEIGSEAEVARQGWDEAFGEPIAWDTGLDEASLDSAALDIGSLELDAGEEEREGFVVDREPAGESWSDATREVEGPRGMTGGAEAPWEADPWGGEVAEVAEAGSGAELLGMEEGAQRAGEDEVADGALEVGAEQEAEGAWALRGGVGAGGRGDDGEGDALGEVAARLEGVARALREGRPLEVAADGDPLQLLVVGYALGYAAARKRGG